MREIKFKAWDVTDKKMVKVNYLTWGRFGDGINVYTNDEISEINEEMPRFFHLMQYTGLKDKNGVEIYEGDILQTNDVDGLLLWVVEFEEEYCGSFSAFVCNAIGHKYSSVHNEAIEEGVVIGNIHENPELMDSKQ